MSRLADLRVQLHKAKPLSERRAALAEALARRVDSLHEATGAVEAAQKRVVACQAAVEDLTKELGALDVLIKAELTAVPTSAASTGPADTEGAAMVLLAQLLTAQQSGQAPPSEFISAASRLLGDYQQFGATDGTQLAVVPKGTVTAALAAPMPSFCALRDSGGHRTTPF